MDLTMRLYFLTGCNNHKLFMKNGVKQCADIQCP